MARVMRVRKGDSDEMHEFAAAANEEGPKATTGCAKGSVKDMGGIGAKIFCRRVQAYDAWGEAIWPYADPRSIDALREVGIKVRSADELQEMLEWDGDFAKVSDRGLINGTKVLVKRTMEYKLLLSWSQCLKGLLAVLARGNVSDLRQAAGQ